jgi:hypothetical protein
MKKIFFAALLILTVCNSNAVDIDRNFRIRPDDYSPALAEINKILYGRLKLIEHFRLVGGSVVCPGPALQKRLEKDFDTFTKLRAANSFPKIDVSQPTSENYDRLKWGTLLFRLVLVPANGFVSYHLKLTIANQSNASDAQKYEDEIVGLTTLEQAYDGTIFWDKMIEMLDDGASFIQKKS